MNLKTIPVSVVFLHVIIMFLNFRDNIHCLIIDSSRSEFNYMTCTQDVFELFRH